MVGFLIDYLVCLVFAGFGFGLPICLWVVLGFLLACAVYVVLAFRAVYS